MVHPSLILNCVTAVSGDIMLSERGGIGSHLATCDDQEHTKWTFWPKCQHRSRAVVHRKTSSDLLQEEGTGHVRIQLWIQRVSQTARPCSGSDLIPVPITGRKICSPRPPPVRRKPEQAGWEEAEGYSGQVPGDLAQGNKSHCGKWVMPLIFLKGKEESWGMAEKTFRQLLSLRQK